MATNRFEGNITTGIEREVAEIYGMFPAKYNALKVEGVLSSAGAGVTTTFPVDYSSTANFACFKTTAETVICRMVLEISLSTFTGSAPQDLTLWLGGAAKLTNGITWGVGTVGTATSAPDLYVSSAAKSLAEFGSVHGAEVFRNTYSVDGTAGDNHDSVLVMYDFENMLGFPLRLMKGQFIGVRLRDDFATTAACSTFTGKVFGRLIFR